MLFSLLEQLRVRTMSEEQAFLHRRARELRAYAATAASPALAASRLRRVAELQMRAAAMDEAEDWRGFRRW